MNENTQAWLDSLDAEQRRKAEGIIAVAKGLGLDDPEGWARGDMSTHGGALAGHVIARMIRRHADDWPPDWLECIAEGTDDGNPVWDAGEEAARRLLACGAEPADITAFARCCKHEAVSWVLWVVGTGFDFEAPERAPHWELIECDPDGNPTGRSLSLHVRDLVGDIYGYQR